MDSEDLRLAVYREFAATGRAADASSLAARFGTGVSEVADGLGDGLAVHGSVARLGMGESADRAKAQVLPAGSFFALSPGSAHYFFADEDTVIQLNSTGPWGIDYVNLKDDPRQKTQ